MRYTLQTHDLSHQLKAVRPLVGHLARCLPLKGPPNNVPVGYRTRKSGVLIGRAQTK